MRDALSVAVAILSALLSMLSRKLGDLVRALFGWSVAALFGRQGAARSTALSVALALSVLWPLFVLGTIVPAAAAWALARLELALARAEAARDARGLLRAAIGFGVATAAAHVALLLLVVAAVLGLGASPLVALGVAAGFVVAGGVAAALARRALPRAPMEETIARVRSDFQRLRERAA